MVDVAPPQGRSRKLLAIRHSRFQNFWEVLPFRPNFAIWRKKSTLQAKENYDRLKNSTEELSGAYETATKVTRDYGVRLGCVLINRVGQISRI